MVGEFSHCDCQFENQKIGFVVGHHLKFPFHFETRRLHIWMCGWYRRWAMIGAICLFFKQQFRPTFFFLTSLKWYDFWAPFHDDSQVFSFCWFFLCFFATGFGGSCWLNHAVFGTWPPFWMRKFCPSFLFFYLTLLTQPSNEATSLWNDYDSCHATLCYSCEYRALPLIQSSNPVPVSHMLLTGCGFFTTSSLRRCSTKLWSRLGTNYVSFLNKLRHWVKMLMAHQLVLQWSLTGPIRETHRTAVWLYRSYG